MLIHVVIQCPVDWTCIAICFNYSEFDYHDGFYRCIIGLAFHVRDVSFIINAISLFIIHNLVMIDFVIIIFRFIFFIIMVITVISTPSHLNFCSSCFSYPVFFLLLVVLFLFMLVFCFFFILVVLYFCSSWINSSVLLIDTWSSWCISSWNEQGRLQRSC